MAVEARRLADVTEGAAAAELVEVLVLVRGAADDGLEFNVAIEDFLANGPPAAGVTLTEDVRRPVAVVSADEVPGRDELGRVEDGPVVVPVRVELVPAADPIGRFAVAGVPVGAAVLVRDEKVVPEVELESGFFTLLVDAPARVGGFDKLLEPVVLLVAPMVEGFFANVPAGGRLGAPLVGRLLVVVLPDEPDTMLVSVSRPDSVADRFASVIFADSSRSRVGELRGASAVVSAIAVVVDGTMELSLGECFL